MNARLGKRRTERGAALILMMTVIVLGIAWYTVSAVGNLARSTADREIATGKALYAAKQALLAYAAQYAARTDHNYPGRMPCPESLSSIGTASEGDAQNTCGNTTIQVGRLPWRTLGVDQIRDGDGELLWYVLSPSFRGSTFPATPLPNPLPASPSTPRPNWPLNFGTPGSIPYNGVTYGAVALIIAPGAALNTMSGPGSPVAPCTRVNQQINRYVSPLVVANFFECGNATGAYANPGTSVWTNDRVISITADEWAAAISPGVADRLQRQVAALIGNWHQIEFDQTGKSWGNTYGFNYLPFASDWNNPWGGDFCANQGQDDGLAPLDTSCTAYDNKWSGTSAGFGGMDTVGGCTDQGTYLRCRFRRTSWATPLTASITATTSNVGHAFRSTIVSSDVAVTGGGAATIAAMTLNASSDATVTINISWPFLVPGTTVEVQVPYLQNAAILSDSRYTWFWNNKWHEYTYYAISPAAMPPGNSACTPGTNCLTVFGLPASTGATNDKRLVMVLSGTPLGTHTQPSASRSDYFELENSTTGDREYQVGTMSTAFNDRVAACPFQHSTPAGAVVICN